MSTRISIIDEREVQIKSQMDLLQTELSDLKREKQLLTATLGSYTADLGSIDSDKKHLSNLVSEMSGLMTRVKSQSQSNERSKGPSTWQSRDEREKRDWDRDDPSFQSSNVRERKYEDYSRRDDNTFSTSRDLVCYVILVDRLFILIQILTNNNSHQERGTLTHTLIVEVVVVMEVDKHMEITINGIVGVNQNKTTVEEEETEVVGTYQETILQEEMKNKTDQEDQEK